MADLPRPFSENILTSFEYVASQHVSQVSLVGSWDKWSNKVPLVKQPDTTVWLVQLTLPPGPVTFKFVIDDKWVTTSTYDVVDDGFGGENNHRIISEPSGNIRLDGDRESIPASDQTSDGAQEQPDNEFDHEKDKKDKKDKKEEEPVNCVIC